MPLKRARPGAFPDGGSDDMPTASYRLSAGRGPASDQHGGAECSAQPPFAIAIAPRAARPPRRRPTPHAPTGHQAPSAAASHGASPIAPAPTGPASRSSAAGAVHLERLLRRHLEELRFTFGDEPLDDLQGFLICEDGNRALIVAADLGPDARSFLYLHCLGHLALGHIDGARLSVTYEFRDRWRLLPAEQAREAAADAWAQQLLAYALTPQHSAAPSLRAIRHQLGALRLPPGYLRACLQRLRIALAADPAPALRRF